MSDNSKIEWTNASWSPVVGCTKCSPGCLNCYAERMAKRLKAMGQRNYRNGFEVTCHPHVLDMPLKWKKPRMIFVCSMSDLFHPKVPFEFIDKVMAVITLCPQHTFQVLTKRIDRMLEYFNLRSKSANYWKKAVPLGRTLEWRGFSLVPFPLPNLWLGVSICTSEEKRNIEILKQISAAVRFVSFEPLLCDMGDINLDGINWVIVGGESGPKKRECKLEWVQSIVDQCKTVNVPVFVKQIHVDGKLYKMPPYFPQEYPK
ncbi:MAG: phage Gp37/Gp68 family protein [Sedimentisphaerales bacterium]|nr:phage Gp37/Gp68 family protein [Sedimentisphaerales bacterium]